jgi:hypothetical protein
MKSIVALVILLFVSISLFAQNGLTGGEYFLLQKDSSTISVNVFKNNEIIEVKNFTIPQKSLYTTDQKARVVVLDKADNSLSLYDIMSSNETKLSIPYDIEPYTILLNDDNIFVGGELGEEMMVQYHIKTDKWYSLEIQSKIRNFRKGIDDLVINDSLLIAIDNIVFPKYLIFYYLNSEGRLILSHIKRLEPSWIGQILAGRLSNKYIGLRTISYGSGFFINSITIYKDVSFDTFFSISLCERTQFMYYANFQTFIDFVIIGDKLLIASKEYGLGIFEIKEEYFKSRLNDVEIMKTKYTNKGIKKLTLIPNTDRVVMTVEDEEGGFNNILIEL